MKETVLFREIKGNVKCTCPLMSYSLIHIIFNFTSFVFVLSDRSLHKMANGTLLISASFPFQSIRSSVVNLKLRACNMIKGSTHRHPLCHLDSIMVTNSPQRSRAAGKKSAVSQEGKEVYRSSDDELPVMRLVQKFVTRAGVLVECTHLGCKPVVEAEDSKCHVSHEWPSFENMMTDIEKSGEEEVVDVVGMYASFLWATEESHDEISH